MCRCYVCGKELSDTDTLYPMPVYNVDLDNKKVDAMGYMMCWDCCSILAMGINSAIFNLRNKDFFCSRGGVKVGNSNGKEGKRGCGGACQVHAVAGASH